MMNNNTKNSDNNIPEELLKLIPWYATGKISDEDRAFFEDALIDYPSLQTHLKQELEMIKFVSENKSLLNQNAIAPVEERLKTVFNMIDADGKSFNQKQANNTSILDKLKAVFSSWLPSNDAVPQYARIMTATVVVVTLAVLAAFVAPIFTEKSDYIPASVSINQDDQQSSSNTSKNTVLLVGFNGSSEQLGKNEVLNGKVLKIESVPNKRGIFQIRFKKALSSDEIKATIEALLSQKDVIWFAGEEY